MEGLFLHELGHMLGLGHTNHQVSTMGVNGSNLNFNGYSYVVTPGSDFVTDMQKAYGSWSGATKDLSIRSTKFKDSLDVPGQLPYSTWSWTMVRQPHFYTTDGEHPQFNFGKRKALRTPWGQRIELEFEIETHHPINSINYGVYISDTPYFRHYWSWDNPSYLIQRFSTGAIDPKNGPSRQKIEVRLPSYAPPWGLSSKQYGYFWVHVVLNDEFKISEFSYDNNIADWPIYTER